jgi:hypothetical protein
LLWLVDCVADGIESQLLDGDFLFFVKAFVHCGRCTSTDLLFHDELLDIDPKVRAFAELRHQEFVGDFLCVHSLACSADFDFGFAVVARGVRLSLVL